MKPYMNPGIRHWKNYKYIDRDIRKLIILLHAKGFQTLSCCQGHWKEQSGYHKEIVDHEAKLYPTLNIPFTEEGYYKNMKFYIAFYIPSKEKYAELKEIYSSLTKRLEKNVSADRLKGLELSISESKRKNLYASIDVTNHPWPDNEYIALRSAFTQLMGEKVKNPNIESIIGEIEEKFKAR